MLFRSLAVVNVSVATFRAGIGLAILIVLQLVLTHTLTFAVLWMPLVWMPLWLGAMALSWLLSGLGVFLRDLSQVTSVVTSLLMFLSGVFYPISSLPTRVATLIQLNPIAVAIEQTRQVVIRGAPPNMNYLAIGITLGLILCEVSLRF